MVENFIRILKGLEDEAEELEELSKLALSPVGVYSTQVSPNPADYTDDLTERAEEALTLIPAAPEPSSEEHAAADEQHQPGRVTASEPPTPAPAPEPVSVSATAAAGSAKGNGRRTSHSWRGLKKQLSRVDLKLKNTFNATPTKKAASASTFYTPGGEQSESDEACSVAGSLPQIITESSDGQEQRPETSGGGGGGGGQSGGDPHQSSASMATRPTELKLFDRDGKPIKPPRSAKEHRKRTSLDKQGNLTAAAAGSSSSRDARLLSVPNIKYSQRDLRHNRSNNQAFINLIKRLSKLLLTDSPTTCKLLYVVVILLTMLLLLLLLLCRYCLSVVDFSASVLRSDAVVTV